MSQKKKPFGNQIGKCLVMFVKQSDLLFVNDTFKANHYTNLFDKTISHYSLTSSHTFQSSLPIYHAQHTHI